MDFARRFLVTISVNKKQPPQLMSGINQGGLHSCPPRRGFWKGRGKYFFVAMNAPPKNCKNSEYI
jgi:hypothetical protein